jgi:hypothetical protein
MHRSIVRVQRLAPGAAVGAAVAGIGLLGLLSAATPASASTTIDIRGSWSEVATTQGANYPQTATFVTENFATGAVTGTEVGGGASFTVTGTIGGSTLSTDTVEAGYSSHAIGTIRNASGTLMMSGTFTDSAGHPTSHRAARSTTTPSTS